MTDFVLCPKCGGREYTILYGNISASYHGYEVACAKCFAVIATASEDLHREDGPSHEAPGGRWWI